jgi:hypothetical protein
MMVKRESMLHHGAVLGREPRQRERQVCIFDRLVEIALFGISGREHINSIPMAPMRYLASFCGFQDGFVAIAVSVVRAGGEKPGQTQMRHVGLGKSLDGFP